jgi:hypothetical protein
MESVLLPYVNLNDRDFVKVSQKLVNDMFDWAIQTSPEFKHKISFIRI